MTAPKRHGRRHRAPDASGSAKGSGGWRRRLWAGLRRWGPWLLALLVLGLVARQAVGIDWGEVLQAIKRQSPTTLLVAAGLAALSHALFSSYDLVGRQVTGHGVGPARTLGIAAMCYAFNLNLGSLIGGIAMRLRLYQRQGVDTATVLHVVGLAWTGNWLGFAAVLGAALLLGSPPMPEGWSWGPAALHVTGAVLVALPVVALLACGRWAGRRLQWRDHHAQVPGWRPAALLIGLATVNWALMGGIVWWLLDGRIGYGSVTAVLLMAAVAGLVVHVPAGLGVIEAVFVSTLGGQLPRSELLAALLAYRAVYYLLPLAGAMLGYGLSEVWGRDRASRGGHETGRRRPQPG